MELKITPELETQISEKVFEAVRDAYYGTVANEINKRLVEKLEKEGALDRIVKGVFDRIVMSEEEYIEKIGAEIKDTLLKTVSTIAKETLNKIEKKVNEYGFIKIADRY